MKPIYEICGLIFLLLAFCVVYARGYDPMANAGAIVRLENVRFTVLTAGVIRMEWAADGVFEDHASLVFVNRNTPVAEFTQQTRHGWLHIETNKFLLKYKIGSGKFNAENLSIEFTMDGIQRSWKPGMENKGNLKGTIRTLDECSGNWNTRTKREIVLDDGLLSRDGWVLIDDSDRPIFDNSDWQWVMPRPKKESEDLYFFCYGDDYKSALHDFTQIAGKIALPPKFVFGTWWSRYWEYTDWELRDLIHEFEIHDVPLDVLVVDMDWHITNMPEWYKDGKKIRDQAGQQAGWTGFSWNRNYFPDPKRFLDWTKYKGLKVCLNLHPASGIQPHEDKYAEMAKAMGVDPNSKQYIPFDIVNKNFAENFLKVMMHPMEADGVDFWWLDWQQWSTTKIKGVNPTFYLNYVFFSDMERQNIKRPLIFHRYGGLGNHRYQIGFSGDTHINWKSLDFQPYFTATASNVGYGFWSHDIGGHMYGKSDAELYTRWVQFGLFSPILRTHCTKASHEGGIERRIWAYPLENFYAMREAFLLRYALIPYIYTAARAAYDTGISICSPMYYDHPKSEPAYQFKNQYMFGNDLLVAPITQPMGKDSLFTLKQIWLPAGDWIEWFSGTKFSGARVIQRAFSLDEIPIYVKAGSIIPMQPKMRYSIEKPINPLILNIFPGTTGKTRVYDDEGNNQNYKSGVFSFTTIYFNRVNDKEMNIVIEPIEGNYPGMLVSRAYEIRLALTLPPAKVKINGEFINNKGNLKANSWNYNGDDLTTHILTAEFSVHEKVEIDVQFPVKESDLLSGKKGKIRRMVKFMKFLARNSWDQSRYSNDLVVQIAQSGHRMTLNPQQVLSEIQNFDSAWQQVLEMIKENCSTNKKFAPYYELLKITERE